MVYAPSYAIAVWCADDQSICAIVNGEQMKFRDPADLAEFLRDRNRALAHREREIQLAQAKWDAALRRDMAARRHSADAREQRERDRLLKKAEQREALKRLDEKGKAALKLMEDIGLL